jgi:hypothetical protein
MKRVLFQAALCAVVLCGSYVKAEECTSCKGAEFFNSQFEQVLKRQKRAENLKNIYRNLVSRVVATIEDKEVVAARGELYKAAKKVVKVARKRLQLTPEDIAQVLCLGEACKKYHAMGAESLTEEESVLFEAVQLMAVELEQEYPADRLERMFDREVELFNQN